MELTEIINIEPDSIIGTPVIYNESKGVLIGLRYVHSEHAELVKTVEVQVRVAGESVVWVSPDLVIVREGE